MSELDATEELVPQASVYDLSSTRIEKSGPAQPSSHNTISLDELMSLTSSSMTGSSSRSEGGEGWESDARSEMGDDEPEDDDTLDRDREEFMRTIRASRGEMPPAKANSCTEVRVATSAAVFSSSSVPPSVTTGHPAEVVSEPLPVVKKAKEKSLGRIFAEGGDVMEEHEREDAERSALEMLQDAIKKKELAPVDHAQVDYLKVRKNLYVVPRALAELARPDAAERLKAIREALTIKVRGKGCPPPVDTWEQCGLPDKVLAYLHKSFGEGSNPFPVQQQAVPCIMSGRDVIGIAKTGSGKTLAFLLPMIRHILDQPELGECEGPIGLIMCPARELAMQIHAEARKVCKALGMRVTAVYGGASVADQIGELKRGAEIVVCTPGRMIDILTMQAGKLISLARCSFVVLDEADRMFDLGLSRRSV